MFRRTSALVLVVALAVTFVGPAEAKKPKGAKKAPITQYLNWMGDCAGSGFLSLKPMPNPDDCALYFPGLGDTHSFSGSEGMPFAMDATQTITVDFVLTSVALVAADFEVVLTGTVNGQDKEIGSATQTIMVGTGSTPVHFDLEPDASLNRGRVESLSLTVNWNSGVAYASIDLQSDSASMQIHRVK